MDKKEAAAALGVSEKTVSRYVAAGRLPYRYVRGKTNKVLEFELIDVERLRVELETPGQPIGEMIEESNTANLDILDQTETGQLSALVPIQREFQSLVGQGAHMLVSPESLVQFAQALEASRDNRDRLGQTDSLLELAVKFNLTVKEASRLTGRSEKDIRDAIKTGKLEAVKLARGAVGMKRSELEKWNG